MDHFVITVARETGSGGHDITRRLSEKLNIPYYDRDLLRKASEVSGIHERLFGAADERIGWKEMLSAAEKVYTGEVLPPDSDDYISTRNLFSFQAKIIKELAATENCIILGRAEAFASKNSVAASALDGVFQGLGYTIVLVIMCVVREFLGSGTFGGGILGVDGAGIRILPEQFPAMMMILPVGGFLTLGCLIALMQWALAKSAKKKEAK